ncbi:MAG: hypothetical protein GVY04_18575, partial [Cyanobacteria bacterium]|nr:hypothetical protein [Cyanobacteria bacterium GSL.Bin1]
MKAKEVLQRYSNGERNFQRVNLQGESFKGADLSGADFSEADIRGTNFRKATLKGTNFSQAKAGLPKRWVIILTAVIIAISLLIGILAGFAGSTAVHFGTFDGVSLTSLEQIIAASIFILIWGVVLVFTIRQGLVAALGIEIVITLVVATFAGAITFAETLTKGLAFAVAGTIMVTFVIIVTILFAIGTAFAVTTTVAGAIAVAGKMSAIAVAIIIVVGALTVAVPYAIILEQVVSVVAAGTVFIIVALTVLSAYLAWRSIKGNERDAWVCKIAVAFATLVGTSFYKADLTDATFTQAQLKNTDLRAKSLIRTCWQGADQLDQVRVGKTLLDQPAVRNLLITKDGYKKSYVAANLEGANLAGVNLESANLKQSNL